MTAWDDVIEATRGHYIETVSIQHGETMESWITTRCRCGAEVFTESWEFTDHIRRIVFDAITGQKPGPFR